MKPRGTCCVGGPADGNHYEILVMAGDHLHLYDGGQVVGVYHGTGRTFKSRVSRVPTGRKALYYEALYLDPEHDALEQLWAAEPTPEPVIA